MTQERSCGTCTKCCEGWLEATIYGQEVKSGSPCRFSGPSGCSIYAERPSDPCVSFKCAWLADPEVPDWVKPERVGAIAYGDKTEKWIALVPAGEAVSDELRSWASAYAKEKGLQLVP